MDVFVGKYVFLHGLCFYCLLHIFCMLSNNLCFRTYFELQDIDKISECVQLWLLSIFFAKCSYKLKFSDFFLTWDKKTCPVQND